MLRQSISPSAHWLYRILEYVQHRTKGLEQTRSVNVKRIGGETFSLSHSTLTEGGLTLLVAGHGGPNAKKVIESLGILSILVLAILMCGSQKAVASDRDPQVLKLHGLYLGMNMDEGAKIIRELITPEIAKKLGEGEPLEVTTIPPYDTCNYGFGFFPYGCPKIFLQSDCSGEKKVYSISIHNDIADRMFEAEMLSQEDFVQAFEERYDIKMKLKVKPKEGGTFAANSWEFESRHGYKVTICQGHTIIVEAVTVN